MELKNPTMEIKSWIFSLLQVWFCTRSKIDASNADRDLDRDRKLFVQAYRFIDRWCYRLLMMKMTCIVFFVESPEWHEILWRRVNRRFPWKQESTWKCSTILSTGISFAIEGAWKATRHSPSLTTMLPNLDHRKENNTTLYPQYTLVLCQLKSIPLESSSTLLRMPFRIRTLHCVISCIRQARLNLFYCFSLPNPPQLCYLWLQIKNM